MNPLVSNARAMDECMQGRLVVLLTSRTCSANGKVYLEEAKFLSNTVRPEISGNHPVVPGRKFAGKERLAEIL